MERATCAGRIVHRTMALDSGIAANTLDPAREGCSMSITQEILLMLHFLSLAAGFAGTFGNIALIMTIAGAPADEIPIVSRIRPALLRISTWGLAGLWVTGILLLLTGWNFRPPPLFWWKLASVVGLTLAVGGVHVLVAQARRSGKPIVEAKMRAAGGSAGIFGLLAIIFAVITFQ